MSSPGKAIVVVGSLHYDLLVEAPHLPALGETVSGRRWYPKFGGKGGNQALAAGRVCSDTRMVGAIGGDDFGSFILDKLRKAGLSTDFVERHENSRSGMSVAISEADGDYGAVIVSGVNLELSAKALVNDALWESAGILVLQNEITDEMNVAAARAGRDRGLRICLNAAPARALPDDLIPLIDILVVNAVEAETYSGIPVNDLDDAGKAAAALVAISPTVIVTAGGYGLATHTRDGMAFSIPAQKVRVVSSHGAGDVFVGTLCAALSSRHDLQTACREATARAAEHVSLEMTTPRSSG